MPRYIDAETIPVLFNEKFKETQKLIEAGETQLDNLAEGFTEAYEVVRSVPPADVQEVRHGKWRDVMPPRFYACSYCGGAGHGIYKFCPWCGAKMDLEESDEKRT